MKHPSKALALLLMLLLLVTTMAFPKNAFAEDTSKNVRVGYMLMDNFQEGMEGEYKSGYGYDYLQQIATLTGWRYEYVYGSFDELLQMLKNGDIDLMGYVIKRPEREAQMLFSDLPQGREFFYIYAPAGTEATSLRAANYPQGKTIGVRNFPTHRAMLKRWLNYKGIDCTIKAFDDTEKMYEAMEKGDIDGIVSSDFYTKPDCVPIERIGYENFRFAVNKARVDLLTDLDKAHYEIFNVNRSFNSELYTKYYGNKIENTGFTPEHKQWLNEHNNTIRLGYLKKSPPYSFENKDGELQGILAKLVEVFENDYGITVETTGFDCPDDMIAAGRAKKIDVFGPLYSDFYISESNGILNTQPFLSTTLMLLHHEQALNQDTMTIAYEDGNVIQKSILLASYPTHKTVKCEDKLACLEAVRHDEADSLLLTTATMNYYKQFDDFKDLHITELDEKTNICLGVGEGRSELLSLVNTVIHTAQNRMNGVSFVESSAAHTSIAAFIAEHSVGIVSILFVIILVLIGFFIYYWRSTRTIIKMKNDNATLSVQAFRDELTKVGNRAAFLAEEALLNDRLKQGQFHDFAVIVIDINGLKTINDTYGHELGDTLITNACRAICEVFKKSPVFRVGGDEFVVLLKGEDYRNRHTLITALRNRCNADYSKTAVQNGAFSMALGVAVFDVDNDTLVHDVLNRADAAMYENKLAMKKQ